MSCSFDEVAVVLVGLCAVILSGQVNIWLVMAATRLPFQLLKGAEQPLVEARRWGDEWGASMMLNLQASIRLAARIALLRAKSPSVAILGFGRNAARM